MRSLLASVACIAAAAAPLAAQTATPADQPGHLYRVPAPVPPALHMLLHRDFDVLGACSAAAPHRPDADLQVVVWPGEEQRRLMAVAPQAQFVRRGRPFREVYAQMLAQAPEVIDPGYYTVAEVEQEIDALVALAPAICRKVDITTFPGAGRSHENRPIFALKVSDNVAADEDEPARLIIAQHHARELNSTHMVIGAMRRVVQGYQSGDPAMRAAADDHELWFVPCVNPDGVAYVWNRDDLWRKNRRDNLDGYFGVDLNRNYPSNWGGCGTSRSTWSSIYKGPTAASEPETRSMMALVDAIRPEVYIDFHSYGREVLFTYPPCANWSSSTQSLLDHYIGDLRGPMSYGTRVPSASGEAPEHFWIDGGTLSFLTEISTSFQPSFSATITEEARVWPGLRQMLTAWQPALRGHVRSIFQAQPVADAEITWGPNSFSEGEVTRVRARDGRYALWLPPGTWQVSWTAPGFDTVTRSVTVSTYDAVQNVEIDMVPSWPAATLTAGGAVAVGGSTMLTYASPGDAGLLAWIALSNSTSPGLPLGSRELPLTPDMLFISSLAAPPLLVGNLGNLTTGGQLVASLNMPAIPALAGLTFHSAGITFEPGYPQGVKRWSQAIQLIVNP